MLLLWDNLGDEKAVTKIIVTLTQENFHAAFHAAFQKLFERYKRFNAAGGD